MHGRVVSGPDPLTLAYGALDAACTVPGVVGISRGRYAIARTFGIGGAAVEGVQMIQAPRGLHVEIHLVVGLCPLLALAAAVRIAVAGALAVLGGEVTAVDVWIDRLSEEAAG